MVTGSPGNTPIFPRIIQGASRNIVNDLAEADNRGTVNVAAAFAALTENAVVGAGLYLIDTDTTISVGLRFEVGAFIIVGAGRTVTINGYIDAGPNQKIFDVSALNSRVIGSFASCEISPCWWGAVPDGDIFGNGTNNLRAFQGCVNARHWNESVKAVIRVPPGDFLIEGAPAPRVPGLAAAGLLQMHTGDAMHGSGMGQTRIIVGNTSSGNILVCGDVDSSGPASEIRDVIIVAELGGAYNGTTGIAGYANGLQISSVWVSAFVTGILLDSTGQMLDNFYCEYCISEGLRSTSGVQHISNGELYLCRDGVVVDSSGVPAKRGITQFTNMQVLQPLTGSGRFGFAFVGSDTEVQCTNCFVDDLDSGLLDVGFYIPGGRVQLSNCWVRGTGNFIGYDLNGTSLVQMNNCTSVLSSGSPTTGLGLSITNNSGSIQVDDCRFEGSYRGIYINTAGSNILINSSICYANTDTGLYIERAARCIVNGGAYSENGVTGLYAKVQFGSEFVGINAVMAMGGLGQAYGIWAQCNDSAGRIRITGGSNCTANVTTNLRNDGSFTGSPQVIITADVVS